MQIRSTIYAYFTYGITYFLLLLFFYAAISKALDYENFQIQLAQSPLLSAYAGLIAPTIIGLELIIVFLLCISTLRTIGLYASFSLMVGFIVYIYMILHYSDFIPCSCGGILEKLSWTEHLVFNILVGICTLLAVILQAKRHAIPYIKLGIYTLLPSLSMVAILLMLFLTSEHLIATTHSFIRRFPPHPIQKDRVYELPANSYYLAGITQQSLYLGNRTTPLVLSQLDSSFTIMHSQLWHPDTLSLPFRSLRFQVQAPYVYSYDGTVPILFRGHLSDTILHTLSYREAYFSQLAILDSTHFAVRTQHGTTQQYVLGTLHPKKDIPVKLYDHLLQKQVDGLFDSDGLLLSDPDLGQFLYRYHYRNPLLVMDTNLHLLRTLHTIDTISQVQLSVHHFRDGRHQLKTPPLRVNQTAAVHRGILFNQSNLKGRYEDRSMWQRAFIIDCYRTDDQYYIGSFYLPNPDQLHLQQLIVADPYLYVLIGNQVFRYRLAPSIRQHFEQGKPKT